MSGIPNTLPGFSTERRFIGPVAQVTVTAGQRFTGFVTVPVSSSGTTQLIVNLCHKLQGTTDLQPFGDETSDIPFPVMAPTMLAVASTIAPAQQGTYQVGLCAMNTLGATAIFDVLNGWIQVTN